MMSPSSRRIASTTPRRRLAEQVFEVLDVADAVGKRRSRNGFLVLRHQRIQLTNAIVAVSAVAGELV